MIDHKTMYAETERWLKEVKMDFDPKAQLGTLSIGQMQSVEIAKAVSQQAKVVIFDEPTRGIDVGAKVEIYNLMNQLKKQGIAVMFVSSEMPEILGITNRIGVMSNGHLSGIVNTKDTNQEELLRLSAKYL